MKIKTVLITLIAMIAYSAFPADIVITNMALPYVTDSEDAALVGGTGDVVWVRSDDLTETLAIGIYDGVSTGAARVNIGANDGLVTFTVPIVSTADSTINGAALVTMLEKIDSIYGGTTTEVMVNLEKGFYDCDNVAFTSDVLISFSGAGAKSSGIYSLTYTNTFAFPNSNLVLQDVLLSGVDLYVTKANIFAESCWVKDSSGLEVVDGYFYMYRALFNGCTIGLGASSSFICDYSELTGVTINSASFFPSLVIRYGIVGSLTCSAPGMFGGQVEFHNCVMTTAGTMVEALWNVYLYNCSNVGSPPNNYLEAGSKLLNSCGSFDQWQADACTIVSCVDIAGTVVPDQ